ncbi:T3SS effector HopA1 family protein [Actinospica durhamensis]|nr:T3SS effector HopA1 family protein [Actinospica durhamensis]
MLKTKPATPGRTLAAALAELRIDADMDQVGVGARTVEADDPVAFRATLATALYEFWHAGTAERETTPAGVRRSPAYEHELTMAFPHTGSVTKATVHALPDGDGDGSALGVIEVNRVRIAVPAQAVAGHAKGEEILVQLPAARPMLSPGFLYATGAAGGADGANVLRMYVHVQDPAHGPALWHTVLSTLEARGARYGAKALSRPESHPRRDAIVLYLPQSAWSCVPDLVRALDGAPGLGEATSVLARRVAPGLALAWEPTDVRPGRTRVSFGQHRTIAVACGVVRHMSDGVDLEQAVAEELNSAGVDPAEPARNLDSPAFPDTGSARRARSGS